MTKQTPSPVTTRPPQVNEKMAGESAAVISPSAARERPMASVRLRPIVTPMSPPAIMNAPAMSENSVVAIWMSSRVAPKVPTRLAVARFIAALSLEVPIWARARTTRGAYVAFAVVSVRRVAPSAVRIVVAIVNLSTRRGAVWRRLDILLSRREFSPECAPRPSCRPKSRATVAILPRYRRPRLLRAGLH